MSLNIKGAYVKGNEVLGDLFDVDVKVGEVTRAPSSHGYVSIYRKDSDEVLVAFDTTHPESFPTSEENWVDILVCMMNISPTNDIVPRQTGRDREYKPKRITTQKQFGQRFIRFHRIHQDLVLMVDDGVDRSDSLPSGIRTYTDFSSSESVDPRIMKNLLFNSRGIYSWTIPQSKDWGNGIDPKDVLVYSMFFKEELGVEEQLNIYLKGVDKYEFRPEQFKDTVDGDNCKLTFAHALVWKSIGDFQYIKSIDDELMFTFERKPGLKLMDVMLRILSNRGDANEKDQVARIITELHGKYAEGDISTYEKNLVRELVTFYESLS